MKKITVFLLFLIAFAQLPAQDYYWVFFKDKASVSFDPYSYFDSKAIARRLQNGLSLYDTTDFPLNEEYKNKTLALAEEYVGETRWFNAVAISASAENITRIEALPFVATVEPILTDLRLASYETDASDFDRPWILDTNDAELLYRQLVVMGGEEFLKNRIDGHGVRIAVFDGGFPGVDKHPCFAHLRESNRIIKTWNFPKKKEDVYGWNSHGTMVLSCIAGKNGNKRLGLATGAEFLLARTEVGPEPKKEEVWWMQAVEWADKNGADVINSSLGYGNSRYNPEEMNSTSLVSRAANMAAAKGMLVCNSMGNEADDKSWKVLITPADADSILSVGGIDPQTMRHIYFSSYGPTADGRMKPNVCAFGQAQVASPRGGFTTVFGTSFSSPLVAGFAACAWQTRPGYTAMQMKSEIERSADKYPYFDYAYGYGIPQAAYFANDKGYKKKTEPTVALRETGDGKIMIEILDFKEKDYLYCHVEGCDGKLKSYWEIGIKSDAHNIKLPDEAVAQGDIIRILYKDYFLETKYEVGKFRDTAPLKNVSWLALKNNSASDVYKRSAFGANSKYYIHPYLAWGFFTPPFDNADYKIKFGKSESLKFGVRFIGNLGKCYRLGAAIEIGSDWYEVRDFMNGEIQGKIKSEHEKVSYLNMEIYQRFKFMSSQLVGIGLYFDTGIYGEWLYSAQHTIKVKDRNVTNITKTKNLADFSRLQWGVRARFGYEIIALYAQYRISDLLTEKKDLPKLEFGLELSIPLSR